VVAGRSFFLAHAAAAMATVEDGSRRFPSSAIVSLAAADMLPTAGMPYNSRFLDRSCPDPARPEGEPAGGRLPPSRICCRGDLGKMGRARKATTEGKPWSARWTPCRGAPRPRWQGQQEARGIRFSRLMRSKVKFRSGTGNRSQNGRWPPSRGRTIWFWIVMPDFRPQRAAACMEMKGYLMERRPQYGRCSTYARYYANFDKMGELGREEYSGIV
jgi:hypothetical protein